MHFGELPLAVKPADSDRLGLSIVNPVIGQRDVCADAEQVAQPVVALEDLPHAAPAESLAGPGGSHVLNSMRTGPGRVEGVVDDDQASA